MTRVAMRRSVLLAFVCAAAGAVGTPAAQAAFSITSLETSLTDPGTTAAPSSSAVLTAGAHPDLAVKLRFPEKFDAATNSRAADGSVKQVGADLPPGLAINPTVTSKCPAQDISGRPKLAMSRGVPPIPRWGS